MAISRSGSLWTPLPNLRFHALDFEECERLMRKALENETIERIAIGWPLYPSGDPCEMTPYVEDYIERLKRVYPNVPIVKVDERNSTVEASAMLHSAGKKSKKQKKTIDSAAACIILERYLKSIGQL